MSARIPPTLGDLIDRLTIIERKEIEAAGEMDKAAFADECDAVVREISIKVQPQLEQWLSLVARLAALNAAIWQRVDRMHSHFQMSTADKAEIGVELYELNQERSSVVGQLDKLSGVKERVEKL